MRKRYVGVEDWTRLIMATRANTATGCWEYQGARNPKGYGRIKMADGVMLTHRFAMEHNLGRKLSSAEWVLHSCDCPPCVNIEHLRIGTALDNSADMVERGRACSVLTEAHVVEAFALYRGGATAAEVAARFGVNAATIKALVRGDTWKHLAHLAPGPRMNGKLTDDDVLAIFAARRGGASFEEIAVQFGVARGTIKGIMQKRSHVHLAHLAPPSFRISRWRHHETLPKTRPLAEVRNRPRAGRSSRAA